MKKTLALAFALFVSIISSKAEDFPYGTYNLDEMKMKTYAKDVSAHGVVLQEYGKTWISTATDIRLVHEYHVKIKIFDSKAFDKGTIKILLRKTDNNIFERAYDIAGKTYYTDNNGAVQQAEFDPKKVFTENHDKFHDAVKFAMPNLKDGCIIEYKYTIESPYLYNFKTWYFQDDIPKISSEYEARVPAFYNYNIVLRGFYKLTKSTSDLDHNCFSIGGNVCDCSRLTYSMTDIPAFKDEAYMTSPHNFLSAMYFELTDYTNFNTGAVVRITKDWQSVDRELKSNEDFGSQIKKGINLFKDRVPGIVAGKTTSLDKAKAIYTYLQKNIKANNIYGIFTDNGVRKAVETHSGSIGDINLSLIAALNAAGFDADAVLLSTRDNGLVNKLFPVLSEFNYVVAKVDIDNKTYLLDATDPLLPFGLLPIDCINDQGRVISQKKSSYWIDLVASQKKGSTNLMDLTLQSTGKLTGTVTIYSTGYEALGKRKAIKKFNSSDEYVEDLDARMPKIKILKAAISNLDTLDGALSEKYDVEIDAYDNMNKERFAFSPFLMNHITENPFKLNERLYPVDWGAPSDKRYIVTVHLPEGYTIENAPENAGLLLPNNGGKFAVSFAPEANMFVYSQIIQFNNSIYTSTEYPYLKEIYNKIIQSQKSDIVFKKKI